MDYTRLFYLKYNVSIEVARSSSGGIVTETNAFTNAFIDVLIDDRMSLTSGVRNARVKWVNNQ